MGVSRLYEYAGHTGDRKSLVKPCRRGSDSKGFALYHGEWRRHKRSGWQGELTLTASPSSILKRLSLPTPWEDPDYELIITRTVCRVPPPIRFFDDKHRIIALVGERKTFRWINWSFMDGHSLKISDVVL